MTFSHAMSAVFCIGCVLYLFIVAVLLSAVLFRLIYSVARRLLMQGKCGKGERGKAAEVKANKGKASSDSFTIGSCKEDPGELSLGAFLCERVMDA